MRPAFLHLAQVVAQLIEFYTNRFFRGQAGLGVAFLDDELLAYLGGTQPRIQPCGLKGRIRLALSLYQGLDIFQQMGQVHFSGFAAPGPKGILTTNAAV